MPKIGEILTWPDRLLIGWVLLGVSVALAIAFSDLEEAAQLPGFVKFMMGVVGSIEPWSQGSRNPHHTSIFFAAMWFLSPFIFCVQFIYRDRLFPLNLRRPEHALRTALAAAFLAMLLVAFSLFGFGSDPELLRDSTSPRSFGRVLGSRLSVGFFGSMMVFYTCYCVLAAGIFLARFVKRESK